MHDAIAAVLGPGHKFTEPRPTTGQFRPHVSAAYVNSDGPIKPITDALSNTNPQPVTANIHTAYVLVFHRDHRMYEWTSARPIGIGDKQLS